MELCQTDMMLKFMLSQYAQLPVPQGILHSWLEKWISEQEKYCVDSTFSARFPWKETGLPQEYFYSENLILMDSIFLLVRVTVGAISIALSLTLSLQNPG
jgi:hypothetical protein